MPIRRLPVAPVEAVDAQLGDIHPFKAAYVDVDLVRIRTWNVE